MWWIPKEKLIWSASFNKLDRFGELYTLLFLHPKRFNFSEWPIRLDQLALNGTQDCPGTNSAKLFSFVSTNGTVNYCYLFNRLYCRYKYRRHQLIFLYIWYTKLQKNCFNQCDRKLLIHYSILSSILHIQSTYSVH